MKRKCVCCNRDAISACSCSNPPVLLCDFHSHSRQSATIHSQVPIYQKIQPESSKNAQKILLEALSQVNSDQSEHLKIFSELTLIIKRKSKELSELSKKKKSQIQNFISFLNSSDKILINVEMTNEEQELNSLLNYGIIDLPKPPDYTKILDSILVEFKKKLIESKRAEVDSSNKMLVFPLPYKNSVYVFNIQNFQENILTFGQDKFPCGYGFTLLPRNELMISGGALAVESKKEKKFLLTSKSIIINPYKKTIKLVNEGLLKSDTGNGTYLDSCVYIFGGFNEHCQGLSSSMKYNCINDTWISICELPQPFAPTSSAAFDKDIYIYSRKSNIIYIYDTLQNIYKEWNFNNVNRILLITQKKILLFNGDTFYLYEYEWRTLMKIEINDMICPYIERDGFIYFMTGKINFVSGKTTELKIYRLSLVTYLLDLIRDNIAIN